MIMFLTVVTLYVITFEYVVHILNDNTFDSMFLTSSVFSHYFMLFILLM